MAEEPGRPAPPNPNHSQKPSNPLANPSSTPMANSANSSLNSSSAADPRIGRVLQERYRITGIIAAGGMGIVYRGERVGLGKVVAIKFLHASMARDPLVARRFEVEARAMSRLCHPNCIGVLDFGVDDLPYVVIDYASGDALDVMIAQGAQPPRRAIKIVRQILAALAHAHAQGIVHRDIKPENIVVEQNPGLADHVRLLDFGLAKLAGSDLGLTAGLAVGTPHYMAPEQMSDGPVDGRADLYSVGIVLFEWLTGQKPFDSPDLSALLLQHLGAPTPPLRQVAPWANFSGPLEAVVMRAMSKRPEQRYPSADAMSAALDDTPEAQGTPGPEVLGAPFAPSSLKSSARRLADAAHARDATVPWSSSRGLAQPPTLGPEVPPAAPEPRAPGDARYRLWLFERPFWLAVSAGLGATLLAGAMVVLGFSGRAPEGLGQGSQPTANAAVVKAAPEAGQAETRSATVASTGTRPSTSRSSGRINASVTATKREPGGAGEAMAQGRQAFADKRPLVGLAAYRRGIAIDPRRRGDATMIKTVIAGLGGDKRAQCATFLRDLGPAATSQLREAARSHPDPKVRSRAAELLPATPSAPPPARRTTPFLRWL